MADIVLKVRPEDLKNKSSEIKKQISDIKGYFDEIDEAITGTKKYWEGEASTQHVNSYNKMKDDIKTIIKRLNEHPKDLEQMAGVYEDTENSIQHAVSALPIDLFD